MNSGSPVSTLRILIANFIGKAVLIFILSVISGVAMNNYFRADAEKARTLTREEYNANYERYIAELSDDDIPTVAAIVIFLFMSVLFFAAYEIIWRLFGLPVRLITAKMSLDPLRNAIMPSLPGDPSRGFPPETGAGG